MTSKRTSSVHAGQLCRKTGGVVNPIEPSSAFRYIDSGDQYYPRYFNTPNQNYINEKLATLEHGEASILLGSGMAAISTTFMALMRPGDHAVLLESLYGGTLSFADTHFSDFGFEYDVANATVDSLMSATNEKTRLILVESPANPLMQIVELEKLCKAAHDRGILVAVDNTFASPINQNPLQHGCDIVIHSGTKYLGGHSDLSFGAVVASNQLIEKIRGTGASMGANLNAMTCYLVERSLKTLAIRVERQNENAEKIACYLSDHSMIEKVYFAGLPGHPNHEIARSQMVGFGGMISFELAGDGCPKAFLKDLKIVTPAMSLGGVESTVTMPVHTSHKPMSTEERARLGISDRLIRLSTGIEDSDDIIQDFEQALNAYACRLKAENAGV